MCSRCSACPCTLDQATDTHSPPTVKWFSVEVVPDDVYFTTSATSGTRLSALADIPKSATRLSELTVTYTVYGNTGVSVTCGVLSGAGATPPPCMPTSVSTTQSPVNSFSQTATYCLGVRVIQCTASKENRADVTLRYVQCTAASALVLLACSHWLKGTLPAACCPASGSHPCACLSTGVFSTASAST